MNFELILASSTGDIKTVNEILLYKKNNDYLKDLTYSEDSMLGDCADREKLKLFLFLLPMNDALTLSSSNGHTEIVKLLLNKRDEFENKTSLNGRKDIVELLNNLLAKNKALFLASMKGHKDIVNLLLDRGADVNYIIDNNLLYKKYIDEKYIDEKYLIDDNYSVLMIALIFSHIEIVNLLLDKGADVNYVSENTEETSLTLASSKGYTKIVEILLEKGADINHKNNHQYTALTIASSKGHTEIVKLLLEKKAYENEDEALGEALVSSIRGRIEIVKLLLDIGANVNYADNTDKKTALLLASSKGYKDIVNLLLDRGANVNYIDPKGNTALSLAVSKDHKEIVEILIKRVELKNNLAATTTDGRKSVRKRSVRKRSVRKRRK